MTMSRVYDLAMVRNDDGRLGLFAAVGPEADSEQPQVVWHSWRDPGDAWTLWQSLEGPPGGFSTRLAVEANPDGRFEVMVEGPESAVWHTWQRADGDGWRGWYSLGRPGVLSDIHAMPALARNFDGRLELFMQGNDGALRHRWQRQPGRGPWAPWDSIGSPSSEVGILSTPVVACNHDGRLELFVRGSDEAAWHVWQRKAGRGPWKPWHSLGKLEQTQLLDLLEVELRNDGCLELFMAGVDGAVWHCRQQEAGRGPWGSWESLGGVEHPIDMAVGAHADGRLILFAVTSEPGDKLWWREQTDVQRSDEWTEWTAVTGTNKARIERPVVGLDAEERLELWLLTPGTLDLCHVEQASPNGRAWTADWMRLGVPEYSPAPHP